MFVRLLVRLYVCIFVIGVHVLFGLQIGCDVTKVCLFRAVSQSPHEHNKRTTHTNTNQTDVKRDVFHSEQHGSHRHQSRFTWCARTSCFSNSRPYVCFDFFLCVCCYSCLCDTHREPNAAGDVVMQPCRSGAANQQFTRGADGKFRSKLSSLLCIDVAEYVLVSVRLLLRDVV